MQILLINNTVLPSFHLFKFVVGVRMISEEILFSAILVVCFVKIIYYHLYSHL